MRRIILSAGAVALLSACSSGDDLTAEEREAEIDAEVAAVEAAQIPPLVPVTPEPLEFADFERESMFGASCSFNSDNSPDEMIALAMSDRGMMRIDGNAEVYAADMGSAESVLGTRSEYDGKTFEFALNIDQGSGEQVGYEATAYPAKLTVRDGRDRTVFEAEGKAICGV